MYIKITALLMVCLLLTPACSHYPKEVEYALKLAGDNRAELERVLEHYRRQSKDHLGYRAACFLIANMPGHFAYDTSRLHVYRPILHEWDAAYLLREVRLDFESRWNDLQNKYPLHTNIFGKTAADIRQITSTYLIENIDSALSVWEKNMYGDSVTFDDFVTYVLPYRKRQGIAIENWRRFFYDKQVEKPTPGSLGITRIVDSLIRPFKNYKHSLSILTDYPFLKFEDLLTAKRSMCRERCWFNTMVLSAAGIPTVSDYVPAWGNRHGNHEWNAVRYNNKTYAFEPFWEKDRWKCSRIYDNKSYHPLWGPFRLPKVFRYSYILQTNGPISDKNALKADIPPLFRNPYQIDVSHEYFDTGDVAINTHAASKESYVYLCVFNDGKWMPVHHTANDSRVFRFKNMGLGILYLPGIYKQGRIIPVDFPLILRRDKTITTLQTSSTVETIRITQVKDLWGVGEWEKKFANAKIQGANRRDFFDAADLATVKGTIAKSVLLKIDSDKKYRYVRFVFPRQHVDQADFEEYGSVYLYGDIAEIQINDYNRMLTGTVICSDNINLWNAKRAFDGDQSVHMVCGAYFSSPQKPVWIGLDMKTPQKITDVDIVPMNYLAYIYKRFTYTLSYWDHDQWNLIGSQTAVSDTIQFENVPQNALLWIQCKEKDMKTRPFTYENGKQVFW